MALPPLEATDHRKMPRQHCCQRRSSLTRHTWYFDIVQIKIITEPSERKYGYRALLHEAWQLLAHAPDRQVAP
jgi:hypothetical protein